MILNHKKRGNNMKRKILCLVVIIALTIVGGNDVYAAETIDNQSNIEDVKKFISEYYNAIDESYAHLEILPELKDYYDSESNLNYIAIDTAVEHRKLQLSDLKYLNYDTHLTFNNLSTEGNIIHIDLDKLTEMNFACLRGEPSSVFENHQLTIQILDGDESFVVVSDEYDDDFKELLEEYSTLGNYQKAETKILQESKMNVEAQQRQQLDLFDFDTEDDCIDESMADAVIMAKGFTNHAYNREAAKNYAYKYVLTPNSNYENFEAIGGNCTNFTSQCLNAGGIPFDETGNYKWYYHSSNNRAPAWSKADEFRNYYKNNYGSASVKGLRAKTSNFESMRLGDLVQLVINFCRS